MTITSISCLSQPNAIYEQKVHTHHEDYAGRFVLLFICSTVACFICPPIALVACILSCVVSVAYCDTVNACFCLHTQALCFASGDKNPRPLMIAALIFIILSFVIGIPLAIVSYVLHHNN